MTLKPYKTHEKNKCKMKKKEGGERKYIPVYVHDTCFNKRTWTQFRQICACNDFVCNICIKYLLYFYLWFMMIGSSHVDRGRKNNL